MRPALSLRVVAKWASLVLLYKYEWLTCQYRELPGEPGNVTPVAVPDPKFVVGQFEHAAKLAKQAGFDGVEYHSANGYIGEQFLSDVSNVRTDSYGGSVENRCRFGLEVVDRLIAVYGADRVGWVGCAVLRGFEACAELCANGYRIKLSPCGGYNDMSFTSPESVLETYKYYIKELDNRGLAYIQCTYYNAYGDSNHGGKPQGWEHDVVKEYGPLM
jgi:2,4-dienoyl-CoA reductase-like NADH-dependent reductase (Old Yellow Enzyme family)